MSNTHDCNDYMLVICCPSILVETGAMTTNNDQSRVVAKDIIPVTNMVRENTQHRQGQYAMVHALFVPGSRWYLREHGDFHTDNHHVWTVWTLKWCSSVCLYTRMEMVLHHEILQAGCSPGGQFLWMVKPPPLTRVTLNDLRVL